MDTPAAPQTNDPFLKGVFASPIIKQLQSGDVPPIYVLPGSLGEHAAALFQKFQAGLPQIGLGVVMAPKSGALVAFNPKLNSPQEILQADAQGALDQLAVPLQTSMNSPGGGAPAAPPPPQPDTAPAAPPPAAAPSVAAGLMGPNPANSPLQRARADAVQPATPVKQPMPSQGLLNGLLSRAQ